MSERKERGSLGDEVTLRLYDEHGKLKTIRLSYKPGLLGNVCIVIISIFLFIPVLIAKLLKKVVS